jgi:hypothetical protein
MDGIPLLERHIPETVLYSSPVLTPTCNKVIVLDLKLASESEKAVEVTMQVGVMNGYTEYQSN